MSTTRESFFKKIDTFVFKQVDLFKASPVYSKIQEPLAMVDEDIRLYINNSISFALVIIPIIFIGIFAYSNFSLKKELKLKSDILMTGQEIIANRNEINTASMALINNSSVDSDASLAQRLKNMGTGSRIDPNKISVSQFIAESSFAKSNKVTASVTISKFSINDLTNFLTGILQREKMKISGMSLRRNEKESQLEGNIHVVFNAQPGMSAEEGGDPSMNGEEE